MKDHEPLPRKFYAPSAKLVAPRLLGHWLLRRTKEGMCGGLIVETEAYLEGDAAAHSFRGRTERNKLMWGPPGFAYVYFIYGNHYCFNAVCRGEGQAEAVLVRAVEPMLGREWMERRRKVAHPRELTNGPGKLCAAMGIGRELNGTDICDVESEVFIARNAGRSRFNRERGPMVTTTRVGITRAAELPLRFFLEGSEHVSRRVKG